MSAHRRPRRARLALTLALVAAFAPHGFETARAIPPRVQPQQASNTTPAASATPSLWQQLSELVHLPTKVIRQVLRGDNAALVGAVVIEGKTRRGWRVLARTERTDLRAPIFDPSARRIVALAPEGIVAVSLDGKQVTELGAVADLSGSRILLLLGWTERRELAFITDDQRAHLLNLQTMSDVSTQLPFEPNARLPWNDIEELSAAARSCGGKMLGVVERAEGRSAKRTDIALQSAGSRTWESVLTRDLETRLHADPVFDRSCKRLAFIARP